MGRQYAHTNSDKDDFRALVSALGRAWKDRRERIWMKDLVAALDARYDLGAKLAREDGVQDILEQMIGRIAAAFGSLSNIKGRRILDIACGSSTSRAPSSLYPNRLFAQRGMTPAAHGYTALFEPWFCRILLEMGANPVGIDLGDLEGEAFEHYHVDLGQSGALDFLPGGSFDAVHDSRLFGSPEFAAQFPSHADRVKVAAEIWRQEQRVLKTGGLVVHSDARELLAGP
jgi:hypothetical protein